MKHPKVQWLLALFFVSVLGACSPKNASDRTENKNLKYQPDWESLHTAPVAPWFEDAKFGIFIHWGAYSVIGHRKDGKGYAEWVPTTMYRDTAYYYPYLEKHFGGHPPEFGYKDIVRLFKAEHWDPHSWADLFEKAGAKYVILTGEHHDGFALWDSKLTDWCATKVGPQRDLVGDLAQAVREKGLKFGPSYHRERHPGFFAKELYAVYSEPLPDIQKEIELDPEAEGLYGPEFSYSDAFIEDYTARWKELQEKYQPDFMWIDDVPIFYKVDTHPQSDKFLDALKYMIADYLNAAESWGKEVYLNNKGKNLNWPEGPGCFEMDNLIMNTISPKWQNPATLGTSYGYMMEEELNDAYKTTGELIHLLIDVVSKNGNLLLNIGPRADGTIPDGMQERLLAIGEWLDINGEAIYGTTPWKELGEGDHIRFTMSKDEKSIYVFQLNWAEGDKLEIRQMGKEAGLIQHSIRNIYLLGAEVQPDWIQQDYALVIEPLSGLVNKHALVWKVQIN